MGLGPESDGEWSYIQLAAMGARVPHVSALGPILFDICISNLEKGVRDNLSVCRLHQSGRGVGLL